MKFNLIALLLLSPIASFFKLHLIFLNKHSRDKALLELIDKKYLISLGNEECDLETNLIIKSDECVEILRLLFDVGIHANEQFFYDENKFIPF